MALWTAKRRQPCRLDRLILAAGWGKPLLDAVAMSQPAWKVIQEFEQDWWASIPR